MILVPQLAFAALSRARSVARLGRPTRPASTPRRSPASLVCRGFERQLVEAAVDRIGRVEGGGRIEPMTPEPPLTGLVALAVDERWDGTGRPFAIPAAAAPRSSRVIAVARAWSSLTAAGSARLRTARRSST